MSILKLLDFYYKKVNSRNKKITTKFKKISNLNDFLLKKKLVDDDYLIYKFKNSNISEKLNFSSIRNFSAKHISEIEYIGLIHRELEYENYFLNLTTGKNYIIFSDNKIVSNEGGKLFDANTQYDKLLDYKLININSNLDDLEDKLLKISFGVKLK